MGLFADPQGGGQRVAQVLRRSAAAKHWSLGPLEAELRLRPFEKLHALMQAEAGRRKVQEVRRSGWMTSASSAGGRCRRGRRRRASGCGRPVEM